MKFSVLLPTRNRLDLLSRAIETVRRQDYENWEIIVSDNFSEEDVAGYVRSLGDQRIKYFRTESFIPVTDNWNNAIEKCDGDYIIMLGDDDGLMKGYFSTLSELIRKYDSPDFIYTNAFLYAYPGVMPGVHDGFLRTYSRRDMFKSAHEPHWLEKNKAIELVQYSLNFRVMFDYNMQFSLVSRRLIEEMKPYGAFYQSPYPDYYASNAMLLMAKRVLVVPRPLVTIGISPKSFGFYYFNDAEASGNAFLKNFPDQIMIDRLREVFLPGPDMNTSWLISMETLAVNFAKEFNLRVNYSSYRYLQICAVYSGLIMGKENAKKICRQLNEKLSIVERVFYALPLSLLALLCIGKYRQSLAGRVLSSTRSHPKVYMPEVVGEFRTILDVFEQIDPVTYSEARE
jgi:glycosyltransferase involved in cell wall biosynthesis